VADHITDGAVTAADASKLMNDAIEAAPHRLYGPLAFLAQDRLMNAQRVADMAALAGEIREGGTAERQIREGVALAKAVLATPSPAALPYLSADRDTCDEPMPVEGDAEAVQTCDQPAVPGTNRCPIHDPRHVEYEAARDAEIAGLRREIEQHRSGESYEIGENYGRVTERADVAARIEQYANTLVVSARMDDLIGTAEAAARNPIKSDLLDLATSLRGNP
jgi:hypothetical protein